MYNIDDIFILRENKFKLKMFFEFLTKDIKDLKSEDFLFYSDIFKYINPEFSIFLKTIDNKSINFNTYKTIYKYLNRFCFRTTPVADNTCVYLVENDNKKLLNKFYDKIGGYRYKISYEWLYKVVDLLEKDTYILDNIKLRFNKSCYKKFNVISNFSYIRDNKNFIELISTSVLDYILNVYKNKFYLNDVVKDLVKKYEIDESIVKKYIYTLIDEGFIITEFRLSPFKINLENIISILKKINYDKDFISILDKIDYILHELNQINSDIVKKDILEKELLRVVSCKNSVSFFKVGKCKYNFDLIKNNIEQFINFLKELMILDNETSYIKSLKENFLEKFGTDSFVSVRLILDDFLGIYNKESNDVNTLSFKAEIFKQKLKDLITICVKNNKKTLDISKIKIQKMENTEEISPDSSFGISFYIKNGTLKLSNMTGSSTSFASFNRFSFYKDKLEKFYLNEEEKNSENYIIVNVSEIIYDYRLNNVSGNVNFYQNFFSNGVFDTGKIYLDDLYVGYDEKIDRLIIVSKSLKKRVKFVSDSMINPTTYSRNIKFLLDISYGYEYHLLEVLNLINDLDVSYMPCIKFNEIILYNERWKLKYFYFDFSNFENFKLSFNSICKKYKLSRYVYLISIDRRIFFDLENNASLRVLYNTLNTNEKNLFLNDVVFEKCDINFFNEYNEICLNEIVCSVVNSEKIVYKNDKFKFDNFIDLDTFTNNIKISKKYSYVKIYSKKNLIEDYVLNELHGFLYKNNFLEEMKFWFYIVYFDKINGYHLRLRVKRKDENKLKEFSNMLFEKGFISDFIFDKYIFEYVRYGGETIRELSERIFNLDSEICIKAILDKLQKNICLFSIFNYFTSFYSEDEFLGIYKIYVDKNKFKKEYRENINDIKDSFGKNLDIFYKNKLKKITILVKEYRVKLDYLEKEEILTNSKFDIIRSIIHMNSNRLLLTRDIEEKYLYFVLHFIYENINRSKFNVGDRFKYGLY